MKALYGLIVSTLVWSCSNKKEDIYKNKFLSFVSKDGIIIDKYNTTFSKDCIFIHDKDSIQDFIVCAFPRKDSTKVEALFKTTLEYIPNGYSIGAQDSIKIFGIYASQGLKIIMKNQNTGSKQVITSHRIEAAGSLIGIVSRVKKWPLSSEWISSQREWKDSWRVNDIYPLE